MNQSILEKLISVKNMYDIFFVSNEVANETAWNNFKQRFPGARRIDNATKFSDVSSKSFTKHFWVIWDNLKLTDDFNLDYVIPEWDKDYIHVFKNGNFYDGVCIFNTNSKILQREWDYRFFTNKKEIDYQASIPQEFDIVFISYNEEFADDNFKKLKENYPNAKRINGVKGIHQAHIEAAKLCTTDMFWVVDADAIILDEFKLDYQIPYYDFAAKKTVHVWRSRNPIKDLEYGYGGIKLFPTQMTIDMDLSNPDMTTSISDYFKAMPEVSNITAFNTDGFTTWRSAFRECCKLASRTIKGQNNDETDQRLSKWCSDYGRDRPFGDYAINGARAGRIYGVANSSNFDALRLINDYDWLKEQFDAGQV